MLERIKFKRITRKGITYELDPTLKTAAVIDYNGEPINIKIPEYIRYRFRKYKVTEIGDYAFCGCSSLTSVTIPNSVTSIGWGAFEKCSSLSSITIPGSVTSIGWGAFGYCDSLTSVTIGSGVQAIREYAFLHIGLRLPKKYTKDGKLIAYKGFNADMTCRGFQYEEGKTYELEGEIELCGRGFHACTNILDVFNYYDGVVGKDVHIHEVYLSGDIDEDNKYDSKVCSSKIEIGPRLNIKDINNVINSK